MEALQIVVGFFKEGGPFMFGILAIGIAGTLIFLERLWFLTKSNINGNHFLARIQSFLIANNTDEAIKFCNSAGNKPLAKIVKSGLIRAPKGEKEVIHALEVTSLEEVPRLQKRTPYLPMCANVATLLGLLGTIIGLIVAFKGMVGLDPAVRQAALAQGISVAMNTTAFGLMVAIPSLVFFSYLQSLTNKILDEIDRGSMKLVDLIKAQESAGSGEEAKAN